MNNTAKIIYNRLENMVFNNHGYFDLSKSKVKTKKDIVNVCNIFRDPRYETFRIFYMSDNKIVGQEAITSRIPNAVIVFSSNKGSINSPIRSYERMKSRMRRLGADGYYLVHNHISDSAIPSLHDMDITRHFAKNLKGFLGHIILTSSDKYSIIEKDSKGRIFMPEEKVLEKLSLDNMTEKLKENTLYDIKISCREDLVSVLKQIQNEKEYSTAILTDGKCNIRMILDIPNKMFNQKVENLNGFFKNLARNSDSIRVFIGTKDIDTYNKVMKHIEYGTIKDMVCFDVKGNLIDTDYIINTQDLFDKERFKKLKGNREER